MRRLLVWMMCAGVTAAAGLAPPQTASATEAVAPKLAEGFVLRPTFTTEHGNFPAGSAFAVDVGGKILIVTAHHLLGPAGGLPAQLTAAQVPEKVSMVTVRDAWSNKVAGKATSALLVEGAVPFTEGAGADLAVFPAVIASGLDRLQARATLELAPSQLAAEQPAVGDLIWLAAPIADKADAKLHAAKVVELADGVVYYEFADKTLNLAGTNGAPLLDAAGKVVGLALGGGTLPDGALIGSGNPLASVKARIDQALK